MDTNGPPLDENLDDLEILREAVRAYFAARKRWQAATDGPESEVAAGAYAKAETALKALVKQ
jgi:predicted transcriptional regulator